MKILLVGPPTPKMKAVTADEEALWESYYTILNCMVYGDLSEEDKANMHYIESQRVGLLSVGSSLLEAGHEVDYIASYGEGEQDFIKRYGEMLHKCQYDIVGFTITTIVYPFAKYLIKGTKRWYPNSVIIAGGIMVSALDDMVLREVPEISYCVLGEGEETAVELVKAIDYCINHDIPFEEII